MRSFASQGRRAWRGMSWLLLAVVIALGVAPAAGAAPEKRLALVIGNARYPALPLNNPENDARVMASTLRRLGFEVREHVNLPVKEFRRVLRDYARALQNEEGVAVFYYAGHGVQIDGRNYLLPVDVNLRDEEEVKDESVDVDELFVSRLERARTQVRIVILDACRDNPFGAKTRNIRSVSGLAEMAARGALIAYASAPGAAAEDGPPGTNSVYTRHLVKEMLVEGIEVEQMFKNVRVKVLRDTQQRQVPWVNTSLTADFSFNPAKSAAGPADATRRDDIVRLQALLDSREREQKKLEDELKRMTRRLQEAEADSGRIPLVPRESIREPARPAAAAPTAERPKGVLPITTEPAAAAAVPGARPAAPAPPPIARPTVPAAARPSAAAATRPAEPRIAQSPGARAAEAAGQRQPSERCVALLIRAQLGEPVGSADAAYLQRECR